MPSSKFRRLTFTALAAALMAVSAWIALPAGPVMFTLQTLALFLTAGLLPTREAMSALAVYLAMGICGLPVFSGFSGGIGAFLSPGGGFLLGFPAALLVCRWIIHAPESSALRLFLGMLAGLLTDYLIGAFYYLFMFAEGAVSALPAVLSVTLLPFLLPDFLKIALAVFLTLRLKPVCERLR